ncbi:hypothetical protein IAU59_000283 [Kwoniella sp. CBS 9459]
MGLHNTSIRISWDEDPGLTWQLLNLIASNAEYRARIFGNAGDRWKAERDVCIEMLKNHPWIKDKADKGLVVKAGGRWKPTAAWTSGMVHPVRNRLSTLTKRMQSGYYQEKYSIDPTWRSEREVPNSVQLSYIAACPYYFLLRQLWQESKTGQGEPSTSSASRPSTGSVNGKGKGKRVADFEEEELAPEPIDLIAATSDNRTGAGGRPPGGSQPHSEVESPVVKRGRGRPPGSGKTNITPNHTQSLTGFTTGNNTEKRGRGRPPGSGTKH